MQPLSEKFHFDIAYARVAALVIAACSFTTAHAQAVNPITTIGIGVAVAPRYEGSGEYHATPFPIVSASRGVFYVDELEGGVAYNLGGNVKVGLALAPSFGRDESDGDRLKGLGDIDTTVTYGPFLDWHPGDLDFSVKYLQSAHRGYGATLTLQSKYNLKLGVRDSLTFATQAIWANSKSMQTYFGVDQTQADHSAAGLSVYTPGAGFKNVNTSAAWTHILTRAWSVNCTAQLGRLIGYASNSPVVERSTSVFAGVGAAYSY